MDYKPETIDHVKSVFDMISLKGKKAVITGGAGGIARATSAAFAELGADIALIDIPAQENEMEKNCTYLQEKFAVKAIPVYADVSSEKSVNDAFAVIEKELGTADIVFANAGVTCTGYDHVDITVETWNKMLDVNLTGVLLTDRAGAEMMKKHGHGGSIINTASMSGHIINRRPTLNAQVGYTTSKAGVLHLTKAMAINYADYGIRVNCISPGYIISGIHNTVKDEIIEYNASTVPIKRFGTLDEIVGGIVFLASDMSAYCLGTDLIVDGGYTIW